jgi:general secretion pathway protein A
MYQDYFGFSSLPFASAPDPQVFYLNPVYQEALAKLQYGILAKRGVIVLTGPVGTGKTALLRKLFDDLGPSVTPVWVINSGISIINVLRTIMAQLDLRSESADRSAMIDALHDYLIQSATRKKITCLVIEEAHSLDSETLEGLRQLCNLEVHSQKLLQLILVGHPEFTKKLDQPEHHSLKQRVALHGRLFALPRSELDRYIEFQLQAAAYHDANLFDPAAIARIAYYSGGIPRLVNGICDNALLAAYRFARKQISPALIDEVAKDMHLVDDQQASPAAPLDDAGWTSRREPPEDSQRKGATWGLRPERASVKDAATAPPRRRLARVFSAALLALIPLGGASWALYFQETTRPLEYLKSRLQAVNSSFAELTTTAETEPIKPLSLQQAAIADDGSTVLEGGQAYPGAVAQTKDSPILKASVPALRKRQNEETNNQARSPASSAVRDRSIQEPAVQRRLLEMDVQKAIQNRAIEGVSVNFIDGAVYLDGQVASETQRSLAERAALGVTEGVTVHNRLEIRR